ADDHWHEPTQSRIVTYRSVQDRIDFVADQAEHWARLRHTAPSERRIAIILANYPNRDGRIGNGVGYDTPASTMAILRALEGAGYRVGNFPAGGNELIEALQAGVTNALHARAKGICRSGGWLEIATYLKHFASLPHVVREEVRDRWGFPEGDPFFEDRGFHLPVKTYGNVAVAIQPARGYNIDPKSTYHDPALVPPHGYFAFYFWLRHCFGADAIIHNGKHGNLEWLPGKATALSSSCYPEAALGPMPQL